MTDAPATPGLDLFIPPGSADPRRRSDLVSGECLVLAQSRLLDAIDQCPL
jgi:hypothetical protein